MKPGGRRIISARRKRRTRQHIIADLSVNHVERFVLLRGHSVELVRRDYGLDLLIFFHDSRGYLLDGHVSVQVKASDSPRYSSDRRFIAVRIDRRDLNAWKNRLEPVILIAYDASSNRAYWLYVQAELERASPSTGASTTFHVPTHQRLNERVIDRLAGYNSQLIQRLLKVVRYEK